MMLILSLNDLSFHFFFFTSRNSDMPRSKVRPGLGCKGGASLANGAGLEER